LHPRGVIDLGQSALAATLFSSNMLFYIEAGYFDRAAEMKPLLHTWSLAIEEQFYIFFPFILILVSKINSKYYLKTFLILGISSLVLCIALTNIDTAAAFYWIPSRAWEFFVGGILALHSIPKPEKRLIREVCSIFGIVMIAYSIFRYSSETDFPGVSAVFPTFGTALIIFSGLGGHSIVSKTLSFPPLVFVGLISYSMYLWHWPIIVFTKIYFIKESIAPVMTIMLPMTFILSILSWKFVESPFRRKVVFKNISSLFCALTVVSIAIIGSGLVLIGAEGFPNRLGHKISQESDKNDPEWCHRASCDNVVERIHEGRDLCDIGKGNAPAVFILWGDSHVRALASGVDLSAKQIGLNGKIAYKAGCPPLLSIERPGRKSCNEFNQAVLEYISAKPEIDTVILAARWALSTKGSRYKMETDSPVQLVDVSGLPGFENLSNAALFEIGLQRMIQRLRNLGKTVVLVNPLPEVGYNVPSALFVATLRGIDVNSIIAPTKEEYEKRTEAVVAIFARLANDRSVEVLSPEVCLCDESYCKVAIDGVSLYRDDDHLSTFGSKYISKSFDEVLKGISTRVTESQKIFSKEGSLTPYFEKDDSITESCEAIEN